MRYRKTLQELTIKDNFMFGAVMTDEEICKDFLEMVLGFKIAQLTVSKEKSFVYHPEYKGVRLDIIAADEKQTHYNVEMQVKYKENLGKRNRYYHSQIDMDLLTTGTDYDLLPDSYVIFICDFDPFHQKKYCYSFENKCREDKDLVLNDGNYTIFLSTRGENKEEVPQELVNFLNYVKDDVPETTECEDEFVKRVQETVRKIKASREMEERYMLLKELIKDEREEAKEEGRAEGRACILLDFLSTLGNVPIEVQEKIRREQDQNVILDYLQKAAKAKTIEEFLKQIL